MAEALGVASGVAGLISLTIEVFGISYRYISEVRGASDTANRFLGELENLKGVLLKIDRLSRELNDVEVFGDGPYSLLSKDDCNNYVELLNTIRKDMEDRLPNGSFRRKVKALTWPFSEERTVALIESLHRHLDIYKMALVANNIAISSLTLNEVRHSRKSQDAAHVSSVLDWLSPLNMYQKQQDTLSRRHGSTGSWLLSEPAFQQWVKSEGSYRTLWCPGDPGTGKTVMTSIVVDYLTRIHGSDDVRVAYVYCDYKDQSVQTASNLIAALARQLVGHPEKLPTQLENMYTELEQHRRRPSLPDMRQLLTTLCNERERTYVIVDALDECEAMHERRHFLPLLESLPHGSTRLFVTSRPYNEDIRHVFLNAPHIPIAAPESDIQQFVQEQMSERKGFIERTTPILRDQITETICSRASGMFLFAVLQIDRICIARTIKKIKVALESMPNELDELYRQTVERIRRQPGDDGELGMKVLSWVTHAKRPLRVDEIQHALAVEIDEDEDPPCQLDFDNILSPQTLTDLCAGLVVIDPNSQVIRLVHYTTQEYFDRERPQFFADTEHDILKVCLTYLMYDVTSVLPTEKHLSKTLHAYPFFGYATLHWFSHLKSIRDYGMRWQIMLEGWSNDVRSTLTDLCDDSHKDTLKKAEAYIDDTEKLLFSTMLLRKLLLPLSTYNRISETNLLNQSHAIPLEAASECGLFDLTQLILTQTRFALEPNPAYGAALNTALLQASSAGHTSIVRLLLTTRYLSDRVPVFKFYSKTPALHAACKNGHVESAKVLVFSGIQVNTWDQWKWMPLHYAAYGGHTEVVIFLRKNGANPYRQTPLGLTALHMAAERGYLDVVALLLRDTLSTQWSTTLKRNTVLHLAAAAGHLNIVSLLLSKGFDLLAQNADGKTARELVPTKDPMRIQAAFSRYTELSFVSQVPADPGAADATSKTTGSRNEKGTAKSYELDDCQVDGINTGPKLCLIAPTPDGSVAGSSDKGSSRSPSPEPPFSTDPRE